MATVVKKDSIDVVKERQEAKRRMLEENPHIPKDELEFMLSLPVERKIPKITELETIHATAEQQRKKWKSCSRKIRMNKQCSLLLIR